VRLAAAGVAKGEHVLPAVQKRSVEERGDLLDTCDTGGDASGRLNIANLQTLTKNNGPFGWSGGTRTNTSK